MEITTPEPLSDGSQLNPADGGGADSPGSISLDQLSQVLGKEFHDIDGALKSIKDTYGYVGSQAQYREKIGALAETLGTDEQGVLSTIETLMSELNNNMDEGGGNGAQPVAPSGQYVTKEDLFFMQNQGLSDLRDVLTPVKNANEQTRDMPWETFVTTETAKKVIEPITGFREIQNQRSVLDSNPRLGSAVDAATRSNELLDASIRAEQSGDVLGANRAMNAARQSAVGSVIEAYGLDK